MHNHRDPVRWKYRSQNRFHYHQMCAGQSSRPYRCPKRVHRMPFRVRSPSTWIWNDRINAIAMIVQLRRHRQPLILAQFHRRLCNLPLVHRHLAVVAQHPAAHFPNLHQSHLIYGKSAQQHNNRRPYDSRLLRSYYSKVNRSRCISLSRHAFPFLWAK